MATQSGPVQCMTTILHGHPAARQSVWLAAGVTGLAADRAAIWRQRLNTHHNCRPCRRPYPAGLSWRRGRRLAGAARRSAANPRGLDTAAITLATTEAVE